MATLATEIRDTCLLLTRNLNKLAAKTVSDKVGLTQLIADVQQAVNSIDLSNVIDDSLVTSGSLTLSIDGIKREITKAITDLIGGAPGAMDTLQELALLLATNQDAITAILTGQAKRVAVDQLQNFDADERATARQNIGAASALALDEYKSAVGDIHMNLTAMVQDELEAGTLPPGG